MPTPLKNEDVWEVLYILWFNRERAMTAMEIAAGVFVNPEQRKRSAAAAVAGRAWELVRRGYVERRLRRRELCEYKITKSGVNALELQRVWNERGS